MAECVDKQFLAHGEGNKATRQERKKSRQDFYDRSSLMYLDRMADTWPTCMPNSLEDLCIRYCVENLDTIATTSVFETLQLKPGILLPKTICDKILNVYALANNVITNEFLHLFTDTESSQISCLSLRYADITNEGLRMVQCHPITDLDLSFCMELTDKCVHYINRMGRTLRSLRFEGMPDIFSKIHLVQESTDVDNGERVFLRDYIFNAPRLRRLCLRDCIFGRPPVSSGQDVLATILGGLSSLTHLDLTHCQVELEFMDCLEEVPNLVSLCIGDVMIEDLEVVLQNICKLKRLQHLDLSHSDSEFIPVMYPDPEKNLRYIVQSLPNLTSLDISGTNLAGLEKAEPVSHTLGPKNNSNVSSLENSCSIPGLEGKHLRFLGLLACAYAACGRKNIPADNYTGEESEELVLYSMHVYVDRKDFLVRSLNNLFNFFRFSKVNNQCSALEGILAGMKRHPQDKHVQVSGSASLFYIAKGPQRHRLTFEQKRRIIDLLLTGMENFCEEQMMMRNGCLTLCHFEIPREVMYSYQRLVAILLMMLRRDHPDEFIQRIGIFLLNCLAIQVDGKEKEFVGEQGAIEIMLDIIRRKLEMEICDEALEVAWSTMWNVTDETAANCNKFLRGGGMEVFLGCLEKFQDRSELLRNMMGLMGNIAEVKELRPDLMTPQYVSVFSDLLDSNRDGIEVSYNAAGVISHLASDGADAWMVDNPSREEVLGRMVSAINRWDINSKRNINYRSFEPILRLVRVHDTPEVQLWAVWALCNLTKVYPQKYCDFLEKEGGLPLLAEVVADGQAFPKTKELAGMVLSNVAEAKRTEQAMQEEDSTFQVVEEIELEENMEEEDDDDDDDQ